ncbi:hypothetical protein A9Q99_01835 [Gammaproteobacteria bacterium 45_16_T64]|nr:hypothetical protein A9Q99_01835 [Gammaproteobacteria bacterium 45_16_T64]
MSKKILIIFNPTAGRGKRTLLESVVSKLEQAACDVEVYDTQCAGDAIQFLQAYDKPIDLIVAAGGDGTTNEVLNGMIGKEDIPLGIISSGTANVLAQELNMPSSAKAIADILVNGKSKPVYPCRLNDKRFIMMVGIGYDAWVVNGTSSALKKSVGKGAYIWSMFKYVLPYGSKQYQIAVDGEQYNVPSMIVTNGKKYGGNFTISQKADISAPTMQALIFTSTNRLTMIGYMLAMVFGIMERCTTLISVPAKRIEVSSNQPDVLQADGDPAGVLPAIMEIEETPIKILVAA